MKICHLGLHSILDEKRRDSSQIWQELMISQFAVGILAHSSDAKILSKYFGEPRIADILQKQNIGKISQTLNLSQMLFSRLMGRIFQKTKP